MKNQQFEHTGVDMQTFSEYIKTMRPDATFISRVAALTSGQVLLPIAFRLGAETQTEFFNRANYRDNNQVSKNF
jgi:hypothetical protein